MNYLVSRAFLRNFLIALGIVCMVLIVTFLSIRVYTGHGRSYAVPDFTDLPLQEAVPLIEKKKLRYEIFDSLYVATKEPGVILEQHPVSGFLVKKNRKIFLTINASGPERIPMPDLVGGTLREGKARIVSNGLVLGKLSYKYDISKNVVLEQRVKGRVIEAGDSIPKGTSVELVLGKGLGNEKSKVPNLIGLTVDEAIARISNEMFSIGAVVPDGTVNEETDTVSARIFRQRPVSDPSVLVPLGSTVSVWTTMDSTKLPQYNRQDEDTEGIIWPELNDEDENDTPDNSSN